MKKFLTALLMATVLLSFTSCSIDTEIDHHKDNTTTTVMSIDMKAFLSIMKDSAFASATKKNDFDKFPKNWTSYYDIRKKDSKKAIPKDSARLYKKVFVKTNIEDKEMVGFSMKFDHFSDADYMMFNSREENDLPITSSTFSKWDGKVLKIDIYVAFS